MTDIKVIADGATVSMNPEEVSLMFRDLSEKETSIARPIWTAMEALHHAEVKRAALLEEPSIDELILRQVVELSRRRDMLGRSTANFVIPVVTNIIRGGAKPFRRYRDLEKKEETLGDNTIQLRFNRATLVYMNGWRIIPPHVRVAIGGVIVSPTVPQGFPMHVPHIHPLDTALYLNIADTRPPGRLNIDGTSYDSQATIMFDLRAKHVLLDLHRYFTRGIKFKESYFAQLVRPRIGPQDSAVPPPLVGRQMTDILELLESMYGNFGPADSVGVDIMLRGFDRIFMWCTLHGKDSEMARELITAYRTQKSMAEHRAAAIRAFIANQALVTVYKSIVEKHLGAAALDKIEAAIRKKPTIVAVAKNILKPLTDAQRRIVDAEYERREKYVEAVLNNKCPHVRLYNRYFRETRSDRAAGIFAELKGYFVENGMNMITCNNCKYNIICPHQVKFIELSAAGALYQDIKAALTPFIDSSAVRGQLHCKVCAGMISSLDAFKDLSDVVDPLALMDEDLKKFMWGEIASLMKYLKFKSVTDVPKVITMIRDTCYPFIYEIEKQILKAKTYSTAEVKAKKRLYATIYGFAYFIHMILAQGGAVGFVDFAGDATVVNLVKHALKIIINSRNVIIREIPGMSGDVIKNILIDAYKLIQAPTQIAPKSVDREGLFNTLVLDPVYKYLYNITVLDKAITKGTVPAPGTLDHVDKIDSIMGAPLAALEKLGDIFSKAAIPACAWKGKKLDKIGNPGPAQFGGYSADYIARSFKLFMLKMTGQLYNTPVHMDVTKKHSHEIETQFRDNWAEYNVAYEEFARLEEDYMRAGAFPHVQSSLWIAEKTTRRWSAPVASLGRKYDEQGRAHKFDIYIAEDGAEHKKADINAQIGKRAQFTAHLVDKKCSVCGILYSAVDTLDISTIYDALRDNSNIGNFYRFYETRCPKKGQHEYVKDECKKCKINPASRGTAAFYRKYKAEYAADRAGLTMQMAERKEPAAAPEGDTAEWSPEFNVIVNLATKLGLNHRLLSALGGVEKAEYSELATGVFVPPEAEFKHSTRVYVVNSYIKNLLTEYNQLLHFSQVLKPPPELLAIVNESRIERRVLDSIADTWPDISNDYFDRFAAFQRGHKARVTVEFAVQSFCEMCMALMDGDKLKELFVGYFVKKTLRSDELLSRPGEFNWDLLYLDRAKKKDDEDPNTSNGDGGEEEDTTEDPFSLDAFDIEDDADGEVSIHVGDNLGL